MDEDGMYGNGMDDYGMDDGMGDGMDDGMDDG